MAAEALTTLDVRGAHGADSLPKVAAALAEALAAADVPPAPVRVVCIPDRDPHGKGERLMRVAAAALRGRGSVAWVEVPVGDDGRGDLSDVAAGAADSAEALRAALATATELHPAPVDVAELSGHVDAALLRALEATAPDALVVFSVPAGGGKTHATLQRAAAEAVRRTSRRDKGRRVAFLASNHRLVGEQHAKLAELRPDTPTQHAHGLLSLCELVKEAERNADRAKLESLKRSRAALARWQFCEGCDRASRTGGTCDGWREPIAPTGTVTHAAHDAGASLMAGAGDDDLTMIDELAGTVEAVKVDAGHLATLEHRTMIARWWYRERCGPRVGAAIWPT